MPRSGDTYTLPVGTEASPGEVITSSKWNTAFDDIEAEMTASAVKTPQYVTLAADSALPNERVLTAGTGISLTDGGAGNAVTVAVSAAGVAEIIDDRVAALVVAGTNITVTYNDGAGTLTIDASATGGVAFAGLANNMEIVASVSSNALTVALKTAAGTDPAGGDAVTLVFPSATEDSGTQTTRSITAATSIVISSGSTLGTANSTAFRFWLVAFDDAGTVRLGLINCRDSNNSVFKLGGWGRASSTAEGGAGAADSAHVFYTGSLVTNMPYIVLGFVEYSSGLATAGTYASAPTRIRMHQRGMKLPGDIVQMKHGIYTTNADNTTVLPIDNSQPQDTEGAQVISFSMANDSACNVNWIGYGGFGGMNATTSLVMAVFQSGSAGAVHAAAQTASSGNVSLVTGEGFIFVGSTSSLTWQLRYGPGTAATARLNGTTAGALLPSAAATYFRNWEIMA